MISFTERTQTCGTLRPDDVSTQVKLYGWVQYVRMNQFIVLFYSDVISFTDRTHTCGTLRPDDVGTQVKLSGWVQHVRMNQFIVLFYFRCDQFH